MSEVEEFELHPMLAALHKAGEKAALTAGTWALGVGRDLLASDDETKRAVFLNAFAWQNSSDKTSQLTHINDAVIYRLLRLELDITWTQGSAVNLVQWARESSRDAEMMFDVIEQYQKENQIGEELWRALKSYQSIVLTEWFYYSVSEKRAIFKRIAKWLGEDTKDLILLNNADPWAQSLLKDIEQTTDDGAASMRPLLSLAMIANGSKPSAKWSKQTAEAGSSLRSEQVREGLGRWIRQFDQPRIEAPDSYPESVWFVSDINGDAMKGLIWLTPQYADKELIRTVAVAGLSGQRKIPGVGPRSSKVTNAAIWALSQIDDEFAIGQLAILRAKIKNKATQKQIDKAMQTIADRVGVSPEEVEEMSVPTYGLTDVGKCVEHLGEFTAELVVTGTSTTEIRWIKPDGKPQKTVPKAVKDGYADELKDLKAAAIDIQKMLPAQRDRIDRLFLEQKRWGYATWAERYLDHPLVGTLARRMIWVFRDGAGKTKTTATWLSGQLVDATGHAVQVDYDSATVSLWHPVGQTEEQVRAWRGFFESHEIKQPFKQAHREVYLLTDAERNTNTYSNRYASHIIKQHQYNALCGARGWRNALRLMVDDSVPSTSRTMPAYNLRAEFWVEGVGEEYGADTNDTGTFLYLATDQVRFYHIGAAENWADAFGGGFTTEAAGPGNGNINEPIPLDQIDPLVLSEVMRDVDLFVGVASVGNDPNWQDGGPEGRYQDYWHSYSFGDLGATAKTRKEILERLVPRLKIAERCSFDDKFLVVQGELRSYKIHLGSSNILMTPNDQYLCIVPGRGDPKVGDQVFLPFEGDQRLAIILSKAMMLAEDTKIKDKTILSQINANKG